MCRSVSEGGRRCAHTATHRAFARLHRKKGRHPERSDEIAARIASLRAARDQYGPIVDDFDMPLPEGVTYALDIARRAGNPLIVGGAVRDAALGAAPKDIDIEVHGTDIDRLAQRFRDEGFKVDEVGKQFGVLKVSKKGVVADLDVAVPRRENKVGAGHRGFTVQTDKDMTVAEAAARRDFTVNAILYDAKHQVIVDPFDGAADLKAGVLRHVSDKFSEDPLRVLRGVQMAGRFGMALDPGTASLCRNLRPEFDALAAERVQEEWAKLYTKSTKPEMAVRALQATGWDDTLPGLREALSDAQAVDNFRRLPEVPLEHRAPVGAALLAARMTPDDRTRFLEYTLVGKEAQEIAADLADSDPARLVDGYARRVHANTLARRGFTFERYAAYAEITGCADTLSAARAGIAEGLGSGPEPPLVQGRDVLVCAGGGRKPGPWVGELVAEALDRQYRGEFADAEAAREWLRGQV